MTNTRSIRSHARSLSFGAGLLLIAGAVTGAQVEPGGQEGDSGHRLLFIEASAEDGFRFPYYLSIAPGVKRTEPVHLLVEPNNTGTTSDDFDLHKDRAERLAKDSYATKLAARLGSPLLVPVFPRPGTEWQRYTHALDRDTMLIDEDPLRRIDEQLIAMIGSARDVLRERGIATRPRIFMHGYSASGNFTNRFAALHPTLVKAVASGGVNATPILPAAEFDGKSLPYPVGVADLEAITGATFDAEVYRRVPQYIYMGYLDRNDTVPFRDAWSEDEAELVKTVLGDPMMPDRWANVQRILRDLKSPAQCVTYNGVAHTIKDEMLYDLVRFFQANAGDELARIVPYAYPFVEYRQLETVHVNGLFWRGDDRIPEQWRGASGVSERVTFLIGLADWLDGQDHRQLKEFRRNTGFRAVLQIDGRMVVKIDDRNLGGTVSTGDGAFQAFLVQLDEAQVEALIPGVAYALVPVSANDDYAWIVEPGVTLVRPEPDDDQAAGPSRTESP